MSKHFSVAIDGPSGAGKSTIARAAAKRFGFIYVDTGAMYRTVGLAAARAGMALGDEGGVIGLLPELDIRFGYAADGTQRMYLNGEDVSGLIRTPEVSMRASAEKRAERRYKELTEKGEDVSYENVLADIIKRDKNDSSRAAAPLRKAEDAVEVDTSALSLDESIDRVCRLISEMIGGVRCE